MMVPGDKNVKGIHAIRGKGVDNLDALKLVWNTRLTFLGIRIQQTQMDLRLWEYFLNHHRDVRTIIELGTARCGLAIFLHLQCIQRGMIFWTFDIREPKELSEPLPYLLDLEQHFVQADVLGDGKRRVANVIMTVERPLLLFCDDGDKKREYREFVPYLEMGDYVGVHDWGSQVGPSDVDIFGDAVAPLHHELWERAGSLTRFFKVAAKLREQGA